jgi:hypothetical protein
MLYVSNLSPTLAALAATISMAFVFEVTESKYCRTKTAK